MTITRGFGLTLDLERGALRHWTMRDGVRRWVDDDTLVEDGRRDDGECAQNQAIATNSPVNSES
jgi:hypothetical protein